MHFSVGGYINGWKHGRFRQLLRKAIRKPKPILESPSPHTLMLPILAAPDQACIGSSRGEKCCPQPVPERTPSGFLILVGHLDSYRHHLGLAASAS